MKTIRECNVAVVGGAGFLGSHLVNHLIEDRGCKVLVIDNLCAGRSEFIHKDAAFTHHDICGSEERLRQEFTEFKMSGSSDKGVKYVFNYAAYPYIPDSFARPIHVADVNFMGAMKVINAVQEAGAEGILQVSSAEIYGEGSLIAGHSEYGSEQKITEECRVNPHSSYGVAKAAVDNWVQVRWREAKTPCIALRQFNCVGERETHPYVVPEIISQLTKQIDAYWQNIGAWYSDETPSLLSKLAETTATVRLGNNSFRDFFYAGDAVKIAVELLERGQFGEVYNLGSETGIKMYDLAKLIGKLMGFAEVKVERDEARVRPWEIWHLQSDNRKIKDAVFSMVGDATFRNLLWGPTSLEESLRRTIKWYEGNGRKWPWEK